MKSSVTIALAVAAGTLPSSQKRGIRRKSAVGLNALATRFLAVIRWAALITEDNSPHTT